MTDKERIEILEQQVALLSKHINENRFTPWNEYSSYIDEKLTEIFKDSKKVVSDVSKVKSGICQILNKTYNCKSVVTFSKEQCEDSKILIDEIISFIQERRKSKDE
ncbi:hypothetical protein [Clostridium butyricum]